MFFPFPNKSTLTLQLVSYNNKTYLSPFVIEDSKTWEVRTLKTQVFELVTCFREVLRPEAQVDQEQCGVGGNVASSE